MANQVAFVNGDGWQGIYINDRLVLQDDRIPPQDVMRIMLYKVFDDEQLFYPDMGWLDEQGEYPNDLNDVLLENGKTVRETRG